MIDLLQYEFLQNALRASLLVSLCAGMIGTLVITHRLVFLTGAVAHAAYGGVGLGYFLGIPPLYGALLFTIPTAMGLGFIRERLKEKSDLLIGMLWATGMAIGVIFLDLTPGYKADLMSYLFGSILTVPMQELWLLAGLNIVLCSLLLFYYHPLNAIASDPDFARLRGLPVTLVQTLLYALIGISVVLCMRTTGLILLLALFCAPAGIAAKHARSPLGMMVRATIYCAIFCLGGLLLSYFANLSPGAMIIMLAATAYVLHLVWDAIVSKNILSGSETD